MTDRLSAITQRMETVRQLGAVVTAMRGIAAARQHEAEQRLDAIRAYAATVGNAIGEALALLPKGDRPAQQPESGEILILLTAEQGFAGSFCDQALDAASPWLAPRDGAPPALILAGTRGRMLAAARGVEPAWCTAMPLHVQEIPGIANRIADALYERLAKDSIGRVILLHAVPDAGSGPRFQPRPLIPLDYARFPVKRAAIAPLVTIAPARLVPMLAQEYVFAELCEALVLAFSAENAARLRAMMAVSEHVRDTAEALAASFRQERQEAITEEVVELAASGL